MADTDDGVEMTGRGHDEEADEEPELESEDIGLLPQEVPYLLRKQPTSYRSAVALFCCVFILCGTGMAVSFGVLLGDEHVDHVTVPAPERTLCSTVRPSPQARTLSYGVWNVAIARRTQLLPVVPYPVGVQMDTATARPLTPGFWVETPAGNGRLKTVARRFCAALNAATGGRTAKEGAQPENGRWACSDPAVPVEECGAPVHGVRVLAGNDASLDRPHLGDSERYRVALLPNSSVVSVTAATSVGALRGLTTLRQAITGTALLPFSSLVVEDAPALAWRGLMLDTARHFIPLPDIRMLVEAMAEAKLNVLHWHVVDAASFPLEIESRPEMTLGAFAPDKVYRARDVRALVSFAASHGVRVVPEIDMPAHVASWVHGAPFSVVNCTSVTRPDPWKRLDLLGLNLLDPRTEGLVRDILRDVAGMFSDTYIHVGGDELPRECWQRDAAFSAEMQARGETMRSLATAHFSSVVATVSSFSRRAIMWQESFDGGFQTGSAVVMQAWKGWGHPSEAERAVEQAVAMGAPWLNSGGWYLDYADSWDSMAAANEWMGQYTRDPGSDSQRRRLRAGYAVPTTATGLGFGGEAAMWTEHVDYTNLHCRVWPRAAAAAETLWRGPGDADSQFREHSRARDRVRALAWRLADAGVPATPTAAPFLGGGGGSGGGGGGAAGGGGGGSDTDADGTAFSGTSTDAAVEAARGMQCPGVVQDMHRPVPRAYRTFMTYNILDGGADRIDQLRAVLVRERPHVVAVVEANGWASVDGGVAAVAGSLGYAFSVRAASPSGYDVVVLSWRPLEVLRRITHAADGTPMSRAAVHVRAQGWDVLAAHLNPASATLRAPEAQALAAVAAEVAAAGRPLVLMGDLNSLSPLDRACHTAEAMREFLARDSEARLRQKFAHDSNGTLTYLPMRALLSAGLRDPAAATMYPPRPEALALVAAGSAVDFVGASGWPRDRYVEAADEEGAALPLAVSTGPGGACADGGFHGDEGLCALCSALRTVPTGIEPDQTGPGDTEPPLRVDYVLFNDAALSRFRSLTCNALHDEVAEGASDHAPVVCRGMTR